MFKILKYSRKLYKNDGFLGLGNLHVGTMLAPRMTHAEDRERRRQIAIGGGIMFVLTLLVCSAIYGWRLLPGLLGEWIGTMVGVMTTPFILESSFVILGFIVVIGVNVWRRSREGDEFVYLEQIKSTELKANLPDQATWAVYTREPLTGETPDLLTQSEGALEIGDLESAANILASMSGEELVRPEVLRLRLRLARAAGKEDLARKLENELQSMPSRTD